MTRLHIIRAAARLKNVTPSEKLVLIQLALVSNTSGISQISQSRVADCQSLSLANVENCFRHLTCSGYILRKALFHKITGHRQVDRTSLLFAKPSFHEPSKALRKKQKVGVGHPQNLGGIIYNREEANLAGVFKLIEGGKK